MIPGNEARPRRWTNVVDLYDDKIYSAIWGTYRHKNGEDRRQLGTRWNGDKAESPKGYPNDRGHPQWHVIPTIFVEIILKEILTRNLANGNTASADNTYRALVEFKENEE